MERKDGFLVINKEKGCTSHDCVKQIRRLLGIKKVGHTGTLDPQVTGVLPIAIGNATRFIQYLPQVKTYVGQIQLGLRTNTDDIYGEVLCTKDWPNLTNKELDRYLNKFRGDIQQVPPTVSSIHINGERAYKKFLKGDKFELLPRKVNVKELELKNWDKIKGILEVKISCSSGTYIRAIARDLGRILGSEGCLLFLKRISACGFHENNSIKITELSNNKERNSNLIIPTLSALDHISTLFLDNEDEINFWRTGRAIDFQLRNFIPEKNCNFKEPLKIIDRQKNLLGIGFINEEQNKLLPKLVLNAK